MFEVFRRIRERQTPAYLSLETKEREGVCQAGSQSDALAPQRHAVTAYNHQVNNESQGGGKAGRARQEVLANT